MITVISLIDQLIFKGEKLVIPEMMSIAHF